MSSTTKPTIFFAHANGFPGQTYRELFRFLETDYHVDYVDNLGHQAAYPPTDNWEHLALELQLAIEQRYDHPIIGVGHSLGGALHLITALRRPELYQQIIILDSPLYGPLKSLAMKLLKRWHWMGKITPARSSAKRRNSWDSKEAAFDYFKTKSLYKNFEPACLRDYVEYGTMMVNGHVKLITQPEIEGQVFENLPDNLAWIKPKIPASFVYADQSDVISKVDRVHLKFKFDLYSIQGGHLFPFEHPRQAAELVREIIDNHSK